MVKYQASKKNTTNRRWIIQSIFYLALFIVTLADLAIAAKSSDKKENEEDPLDLINKQIAALEAKMSAIEHIKLYADSVNLQDLSSRDIEQTVAHFLKSTRGKSAAAPAGVVDVSAERKASLQDKSNAMASMVGNNKNSQQQQSAEQIRAQKAISEQAQILNQFIGKSMTEVSSNLVGADYIHTFVSTRSLRQQMQTTISNIVVIAAAPGAKATSEGDSSSSSSSSGFFQMLDQDGSLVFEHTLQKQVCKPGSKRSFIRSSNQNDMAFGYLCHGPAGGSLGLYRFEVRDDEVEKKLKRVALGEIWAIDLAESGIELDSSKGGIQSAILTRSMSQRLKFILATHEKIAIISTKDGKVENQILIEDGIDSTAPMKLFAFQTGFGIQNKNRLIIKKLASSGQIDSTYQPCSTISNLVDIVYDFSNPSLLFGLTEVTNELILFSALSSKQECQVAARMPLSEMDEKTVFDQLQMIGPVLIARSTIDSSLHLFKTNPEDQHAFMVSTIKPLPAVFKMPKCPTGDQDQLASSEQQPAHLGDFYVADGSLMTVEVCPGQILTIQSSLKSTLGDDENSWMSFFVRNALKIAMTAGLTITGIYQYFRITGEKKAKVAEKQQQQQPGGAQQMKNQGRPGSGRSAPSQQASQKRGGRGQPAAPSRRQKDQSDDDDDNYGMETGSGGEMNSLPGMVGQGFNKQKGELDRLQQQLEDMENKMSGGGSDMARMMDQLASLQKQTEMIGNAAGSLGKGLKKTSKASELLKDDDDGDDNGGESGRFQIDTSNRRRK